MSSKELARRRARRRRFYLKRFAFLGGILLLTAGLAGLLLSCVLADPAETVAPSGEGRTSPAAPDAAETGEVSETASEPLPEGWERIDVPESALAEGTLVLVNGEAAFDASRAKTISVYEGKNRNYLVKNIYLSVTPETLEALNAWMEAFAGETGITDVNIVAGWRSLEDQTKLYDNAVAKKGQGYADTYLALPGHSEHHTGLAVDLDTYNVEDGTSGGFDGEGEYAWAVDHAWEYGFIQRYPPSKSGITGIDYESWHFRYVGLPHSCVMASENLCLEEYIELLRGYPFFGEHLSVCCLGVDYELYFCPKDRVIVPTAGRYTVCGNNVDGFVVVLKKTEPAA